MNAGPVQEYQTCILVGSSLTDMTMTAGLVQLRYSKWQGAIVTDMADGPVQM